MSTPSDPAAGSDPKNPAPLTSQQRRRLYAAGYRERNREKITAYRRAYNERNREHILEEKRRSEQRRKARLAHAVDARQAAVERARRWAQANPERAAANRQRWVDANPDKQRASARAYAARVRAENPEKLRAASARWRTENPDKVAEYRARRRALGLAPARRATRTPEQYAHDLQVSRDRRRMLRRLSAAGLPPPQVRQRSRHERTDSAAAAREFFERARDREQLRRIIRIEFAPPTVAELTAAAQDRASLRRAEATRDRLVSYVHRHQHRLRIEADLDSRARQARGSAPLDIEGEVIRRAREAVTGARAVPITVQSPAPTRAERDIWRAVHERGTVQLDTQWDVGRQ